uniref:asparagine synthase (glutamine-hydrolyzing) n=1 Tax=Ignavibacterium album TaxID=591197 RepID=A0A832DP79_9BACT
MCGIFGIIDHYKNSDESDLKRSINTLSHRGPDDLGIESFNTDAAYVGLAHTRLSILDLSSAGHQPMSYENYIIVLNGEIYNFKEIRKQLSDEGYTFISNSDTEVVVKAFAKWGKECVNRFIGMFSFCIYDKKSNTIHLCRDRAGVKPLYYYNNNGLFLFSSEIKAFHQNQFFNKAIDETSVSNFIQFGYIPGSNSIFKYVKKVPPGSWLTYNILSNEIDTEFYWKLSDYFKKPLLDINYEDAKKQLEELLYSSCQYRMIADVPVGIFLSGGYDSTLVTALLQKNSNEKLNTFTIGFPDGIDESEYAKKVANYLGTKHTNLNFTKKDAIEIIEELPYYYDEPMADISAIPSILVSRLARESVKVALSADGGDELFAGYSWYKNITYRYNQAKKIPELLNPFVKFLLRLSKSFIPVNKYHFKHQINSFYEILNSASSQRIAELIYNTKSLSDIFNKKLIINYKPSKPDIFTESYLDFNDKLAPMLYIDYMMNLTDCLLVKVDRASMSTSLESREPLMDHRLAEFAAQLPICFKYDGTTHKKILKDIVHKYVPAEIMDRPKVGFDLPLNNYLRNDLSWLIDDYLSVNAIAETGFFNPEFVLKIVNRFRVNKLVYSPVIWRLIVFQQWYKKWLK